MGWFWVDKPCPSTTVAPHPPTKSNATPPPGCPMHTPISSTPSFPPRNSSGCSTAGSCPVRAPNEPLEPSAPPPSTSSRLNPLNYMFPNISQSRAPNQCIDLPTERETSSIPRGDSESNWEYPSPQQMYNAMLRKGYDETPQDAVESMVAVHNFLNEGAWEEIVNWERRFSRGLGYGWQACRRGEEGFIEDADKVAPEGQIAKPKLLRFQGRPDDISPKARIFDFLGRMYPAKFNFDAPFDRHDWYVLRRTPQGDVRVVRYVIDYYSVPETTGPPVFSLDVRPAVDGPTAAAERLMRWGGDVWHRASGGKARENVPS